MRRPNSVEMLSLLDNYRAARGSEQAFAQHTHLTGVIAGICGLVLTGSLQVAGDTIPAIAGGVVWAAAAAGVYYAKRFSPARERRITDADAVTEACHALERQDSAEPEYGEPYAEAHALQRCLIEARTISAASDDERDSIEVRWQETVNRWLGVDSPSSVIDAFGFVTLSGRYCGVASRDAAETNFEMFKHLHPAWEAIKPIRSTWRVSLHAGESRYWTQVTDGEVWRALVQLASSGPNTVRVAAALADPTWNLTQLVEAASQVAAVGT